MAMMAWLYEYVFYKSDRCSPTIVNARSVEYEGGRPRFVDPVVLCAQAATPGAATYLDLRQVENVGFSVFPVGFGWFGWSESVPRILGAGDPSLYKRGASITATYALGSTRLPHNALCILPSIEDIRDCRHSIDPLFSARAPLPFYQYAVYAAFEIRDGRIELRGVSSSPHRLVFGIPLRGLDVYICVGPCVDLTSDRFQNQRVVCKLAPHESSRLKLTSELNSRIDRAEEILCVHDVSDEERYLVSAARYGGRFVPAQFALGSQSSIYYASDSQLQTLRTAPWAELRDSEAARAAFVEARSGAEETFIDDEKEEAAASVARAAFMGARSMAEETDALAASGARSAFVGSRSMAEETEELAASGARTPLKRGILYNVAKPDSVFERQPLKRRAIARPEASPNTGMLLESIGRVSTRASADPLPERASADPLPERASADPLPERASADPLPERASADPLPERASGSWFESLVSFFGL
jgi:hypothetical protein